MRLLLAEPSPVLRTGLARLLGGLGHHVAAGRDTGALAALAAAHRPDVLLVSAAAAPARGGDAVRDALAVRRRRPGTGVLLWSRTPDPRAAAALLEAGGPGLGHQLEAGMTDADRVVAVLARIAAGGRALDPAAGGGAAAGDLASLSVREAEVLALMAQGRTNTAIAARLCISEGTVEKRVAAVFGKLGIPGGSGDNRRVLAVLRYLEARAVPAPGEFAAAA
ncbi:response regulator transcription factor [Streptomyces sp. NPDC057682]|uniref:helix-turn-helix transcriptional regulator n=1 Tax=Streptomyces sp. NPDC057682 TaxID=3346210 RepID=UPI00368F0848